MTREPSAQGAAPASGSQEPGSAASSTRRYVVGYGGDKRSRDAVRLGVALARAIQAELEIVCVLRTEDETFRPTYPPVGDISPMLEEQAYRWLRDAMNLVPEDVTARAHLRHSPSLSQGLVDAVQEFDAGLMVMGAAAGNYKAQFSVGPIVEALLHRAPVPVALAPRGYKGEDPITRLYAGVGARAGAQRILRESEEAVNRAGLELVLLNFLPLDHVAGEPDASVASVEAMLRDTAEEVHTAGNVKIQVASGKNLKRTVKDMDWAPGSVLFVGSSRLAQHRQTFLGTTAARVLRHLPIPMIVLPASAGDGTGGTAHEEES